MKDSNISDKKIYVALSGGVDSSVVAALLVERGYDVTGVYMKNWSNNNGISDTCPWEEDVAEVEKVANHLGIPWKVYNFEKEYKERILNYFFHEYKVGRTPNPDILCNNLVKFDLFAKKVFAEGATHVATGHYARRQGTQGFPWEQTGELGLYTAIDSTKDQCYFLQRLSKEQLENALFPLGGLYKSEVRVLAKQFNLPNALRKDSQGICFIGDIDVKDFIRKNLQTNPGDIIDTDSGKIVGKHQGLWFYTIGQRQGIEIASSGEPYFVVGKNAVNNQLEIARGHEHHLLRKKIIKITDLHSMTEKIQDGQLLLAALRYREVPQLARIKILDDESAELVAMTEKLFWAAAPGQGVLLYEDTEVGKFAERREPVFSAVNAEVKQCIGEYFTVRESLERYVRIIGAATIAI
jgi:tRNA-specific 2-thiouridylase